MTVSRWALLGYQESVDVMVANLHAMFVATARYLVSVADAQRTSDAR